MPDDPQKEIQEYEAELPPKTKTLLEADISKVQAKREVLKEEKLKTPEIAKQNLASLIKDPKQFSAQMKKAHAAHIINNVLRKKMKKITNGEG